MGKSGNGYRYPAVYAGKEAFEADEVYVCNGADFETLYPDIFAISLNKMQTADDADGCTAGKHGGLALCYAVHYPFFITAAFKPAASLGKLKNDLKQNTPNTCNGVSM